MGGPGAPQGGLPQLNKPQKKKAPPKLLDDNNGKNKLKFGVNKLYQLYCMVRDFSKNFLWMCSCFGLMFLFPMALEHMSEQNRIMMKIQMQMQGGMDMMGPPQGGNQVQMRPY